MVVGAAFTVDHALDCRSVVEDLAFLVWNSEPIVKEAGDDEQGALVADLAIRGVWQSQCESIFDIRVVGTDALSYYSHAPQDVL